MGQLNKVLLCIFLLLFHLFGRQKIHQFQATFTHRLDIEPHVVAFSEFPDNRIEKQIGFVTVAV